MPGSMMNFNQGPGRRANFDPTEGMDIVWLNGMPVLKSDAGKMQGQQESKGDAWKNWKSWTW
eukprot:853583-Prorocentrum_lima.AAC.1